MIDRSESPRPPHRAMRAIAALVCGVVVATLAYHSAWKASRGNPILFADHHRAVREMAMMTGAIKDFEDQQGSLPVTWNDIALPETQVFHKDDEGTPLDPWGYAYSYRVEADGYELLSYGRDGAPGGVGLDADLLSQPEQHWPGSATLSQYTFDLPTGDIKATCILAGICTAIACWLLAVRTSGGPVVFKLFAWGVTLVFACLVAQTMAVLHIPSGH